MWIPQTLLGILTINKDAVDDFRVKVAVLEAKNALIERELLAARVNSDWMRMRVNQLEIERSALMEKAYPGLHIPTPEIARISNRVKEAFDLTSLFDDAGDDPSVPIS